MKKLKAIWHILRGHGVIFKVMFMPGKGEEIFRVDTNPPNPFVYADEIQFKVSYPSETSEAKMKVEE